MNEINFNIEDIETINLSMDVGIKEIYPPIENLEVTPTKEQQTFNHENSYGYDNVTVEPIPDEYIIPDGTLDVAENGDVDVTMFRMARVGVYTPPNLQDKTVTPTKNIQTITSDEGYDGLNEVTVNAIPDNYIEPSGSLEITENGTYDVKQYAEVTTNISGGGSSSIGQPVYVKGSISEGNSTSLSYQSLKISAGTSTTSGENGNLGLVFGFVRSSYTITGADITILAEKTFSDAGSTQTLFVGCFPYNNETITLELTTTSAGRMAMGYMILQNADIPQVIEDIKGGTRSSIDITTDNNFNVYLFSQAQGYSLTPENFPKWFRGQTRLACYISTYESDDKKIAIGSSTYNEVIHLCCPAKK